MAEPVLLVLLFLGLLIASYQDIRTREIPDTVSYGLITIGLLGGLILALLAEDLWIFLDHLFGFGAGLAVGLAMFYGRQWGGGDAKLIMGVGAIIGLSATNLDLAAYLALLVFAGAAYGMCYTAALAIAHRKAFGPAFLAKLQTPRIRRARIGLIATGVIVIIAFLLVRSLEERLFLGLFLLAAYTLMYGWIAIQTVEEKILLKTYPVGKLTEGDWVAEDVRVRGRLVIGKRNTGITLPQIAQLKKANVRKVLVREGIPFVPSFLLAFLALLALDAAGIGLAAFLG